MKFLVTISLTIFSFHLFASIQPKEALFLSPTVIKACERAFKGFVKVQKENGKLLYQIKINQSIKVSSTIDSKESFLVNHLGTLLSYKRKGISLVLDRSSIIL